MGKNVTQFDEQTVDTSGIAWIPIWDVDAGKMKKISKANLQKLISLNSIPGDFGSNSLLTTPVSGTEDGFNWAGSFLIISRSGASLASFRRRSSDGTVFAFYRDSSLVGSVSVTTTATAYNTTSDHRLKEDETEFSNAIEKLLKIKIYNFKWKDHEKRSQGVFAHELEEVVPDAVTGQKDEIDKNGDPVYQSVDYSKLVPLLVKSIQEQQSQIDALKRRLENGGR